jgi:hypothetical protein
VVLTGKTKKFRCYKTVYPSLGLVLLTSPLYSLSLFIIIIIIIIIIIVHLTTLFQYLRLYSVDAGDIPAASKQFLLNPD